MSVAPDQIPDEHAEEPVESRGRGRGEQARTGALVFLAVLATLFAVLNIDEVKVHWIVGSGRAPLIIVIVISLLAGIVLSYFADRLTRKRRR